MNLGIGEHDAHFADIFDGEFGFAVWAGDAADSAWQVIAFEFFDVGDFKGFEEKVVESDQSQSVGHIETQNESANEIGSLLNRTWQKETNKRFESNETVLVKITISGILCNI